MASLLNGADLRLMDCTRLRVKDIDFSRNQITVRAGKGSKDRVTMLPRKLQEQPVPHLEKVRVLYNQDLAAGQVDVYLPDALARKYPQAGREWAWQWAFPAKMLSTDPRTGSVRRRGFGVRARAYAVLPQA